MINEWNLEEFSADDIEKNIEKNIFVVPRYQRGVVWKDQQRADLVDTIKKDYHLVHYCFIKILRGNIKLLMVYKEVMQLLVL